MKVSELAKCIGCEMVSAKYNDAEVLNAYTSDLLSDVLANAPDGSVFITMQSHKNSVAVASQLDFPALIICNGRTVTEDMIKAAENDGIAIMRTAENQFVTSYKVYNALFGAV